MVFLANFAGGFQTAYEQVSGEAIHLPPKTTSVQEWAERLQEYASQQNCSKSRTTGWQSAKTGRSLARRLFWERTRWLRRTPYQSHLIRKKPKLYCSKFQAYNTQINDVLLTALVLLQSGQERNAVGGNKKTRTGGRFR